MGNIQRDAVRYLALERGFALEDPAWHLGKIGGMCPDHDEQRIDERVALDERSVEVDTERPRAGQGRTRPGGGNRSNKGAEAIGHEHAQYSIRGYKILRRGRFPAASDGLWPCRFLLLFRDGTHQNGMQVLHRNETTGTQRPLLRLSVLDQAPVAEGTSPGEALDRSVDLAQQTERLGYTRFWMSEHHAMQTLACSAPEVVLARIGASTRSIRIGSGGIMLPHYSPLKVAEAFMTLAAMYPDRIDLGIGRAPGGGPVESQALRRIRIGMAPDDFPEQMAELFTWLGQSDGFTAGHPFGRVQLSPSARIGPKVWLLGSSMWGAAAAAQWGLPYAFAHFFSPVATRAALESYRRSFVPSTFPGRVQPQPQATAAVGVIVADTDEEAAYLHSSVRLLQQRIRQGDRRPVARPDQALRDLNTLFGPQASGEEGEFPRYIVGNPKTVERELGAMASALHLDEIVVNTITHDHAARIRSYRLLAEIFPQRPAQTEQGLMERVPFAVGSASN